MPYLSGFVAKKRNVEREQLAAEVRERMVSYSEQLLKNTVHGYATVSPSRPNLTLLHSHWEYSLLPIWMLTYKDRGGKTYTYAMNGYTGKVYGELPISWAKLGLLFGALAAALTPILTLIGGSFF